MKDEIKAIIADILYLDSLDEINDNDALFTQLGLSSIDYIDLTFELKKKFECEVTQDNLWPINKLTLDDSCYNNGHWTRMGWDKVRELLSLRDDELPKELSKLYDYFNVSYIEKRIKAIA